MRKIVLDTSTIISISDKCMTKIFENIAKKEKVKFYIPEHVYYEAVMRPIEIRRFEFNAIRIRELIRKGAITVQNENNELRALSDEVHSILSNVFSFKNQNIEMVQKGEADALALLKYLNADIFAVDERTTRMLLEEPQNLKTFLRKRHNKPIAMSSYYVEVLKEFLGDVTVVRSVELVAYAYNNNCFADALPPTKEALEAALFALKYAGCAISADEILSYMKGV